MNDKYILDADGNPVVEPDLIKWVKSFETMDRIVKKTQLSHGVKVSTVFLGLDHSFGGSKPILWETMIFGGEHDGYQERYSTHDDALSGHDKAIAMLTDRNKL